MKINEQIGGIRIIDFPETVFRHMSFDCGFHFATQKVAVRIIVTSDRFRAAAGTFTARYHVARNDRTGTLAAGFFLSRAPGPCGMTSDVRVSVSRDLHIFIASGEQEGASYGACREKRNSRVSKLLGWHLNFPPSDSNSIPVV
jgi:hypothetical protein